MDWDNDGDFSGVHEDVTGDTLGLTLEHFRDLASGHVEAARLELELKNDDHRYSPPNPRSPLSGLLKPGRKVWLRAAYPYDALADAPGVRLSGHAPDLDPSFSWTEHARGLQDRHVRDGGDDRGRRGRCPRRDDGLRRAGTRRSGAGSRRARTQRATAGCAFGTRTLRATCTSG